MKPEDLLAIHSGLEPTLTHAQFLHVREAWGKERVHVNISDGITEPWTVDLWCAMLLAMQPERVLECGTSTGLTTQRLLETLGKVAELLEKPCSLTTVDNETGRQNRARPRLAATAAIVPAVRLDIVHADTLEWLATQPADSFDFAILDDGHKRPHVMKEIPLAIAAVRSGGTIIVHDTVESPHGLDEIVRAHGGVNMETKKVHKVSAGLGILEVRK